MAFVSKEKVLWEDLLAIYSNLNTARSTFGFTEVNSPNQKITYASQVSNLNTLIKEMSSNSFLSSIATGLSNLPSAGEVMKPNFLADLNNQVDQMNQTCYFNSSDFSFSGNFSFDSGNFSFSSNRSFDSGNFSFSGNRSFNSSDFSFSGNRSFNSSDFSFSGNRSFNSSDFSFTASPNSNRGTFSWRGGSFNSFFTNSSNMTNHQSTSGY